MIALESGSAIWKKNLAWVQPSIALFAIAVIVTLLNIALLFVQ